MLVSHDLQPDDAGDLKHMVTFFTLELSHTWSKSVQLKEKIWRDLGELQAWLLSFTKVRDNMCVFQLHRNDTKLLGVKYFTMQISDKFLP